MLKINETKKENVGARLCFCPNNGITLIALIITIIVMLILVAVTITVAVNGGLFEHAGQAAGDTQNEINKEQILANGKVEVDGKWYNSIDDYIAGKYEGYVPTYAEAKFKNGVLTENARYTSGDYTAIIPKGFAISKIQAEQTIANGLVITDAVDSQGNSIGNEFVWIPVNYTATGTLDSNGLDSGFLAVFYRSLWVADNANGGARGEKIASTSRYTEPYAGGYSDGKGTEESKEYYEMMRSVQENKGFYIGRFEAGSTTARTQYESDGTTYRANGTTQMVVKRDAYPYAYVGWGKDMSDYESIIKYHFESLSYSESGVDEGKGAVLLSKELYGKAEDAGKYGVVSTLCYGVQWDAVLDFVKDSTHNVISYKPWGNSYNNLWTITRKTAKYSEDGGETWILIDDETDDKKVKTSESSILLTTGASDSFAAKNIFDVAGNVCEWTNEADSYMYRMFRGGDYADYMGASNPASYRGSIYPYICNGRKRFSPYTVCQVEVLFEGI